MKPRWTLVSYFYPPQNNIASQRWKRFSQSLSRQGVLLDVYCNDWGPLENLSGIQVHALKDRHSSDSQGVPKDLKSQRRSVKGRLLRWLPLYLLIDGKWLWSFKVFWSLLIKKNAPELVIVTGTPWSAIVAASLACRLRGWRTVLEFRDLWATEPYRLHFNQKFARTYFRFLEAWCVSQASDLIVINDKMDDYFKVLDPGKQILLIPHGLKDADLSQEFLSSNQNCRGEILYAGSVSNYHGLDRFLDFLKESEVPLKPFLRVLGEDHTGILKVEGIPSSPSVNEDRALEEMKKAAVLLLCLNQNATHYTTGKLWSYIEACRPILYFGPPQSPAAKLIETLGIGWVIDCDRPQALIDLAPALKSFLESKTDQMPLNPKSASLKALQVDSLMAQLIMALRGQTPVIEKPLERIKNEKANQISGPEPSP